MTIFNECKRCLLDNTVPFITYDDNGMCSYCAKHDAMEAYYKAINHDQYIDNLTKTIKKTGAGKAYDCIVGLSGGTDSTYVLYQAVKMGLRPLAVNFDNGWNSAIAVSNIRKATDSLGVDLYTYVIDWEEFKDLQKSFLKASVPCIEVPTDVAISGILFRIAAREKVSYILNGMSYKTEGTVPLDWSYIDGTYVKNVHRKFGSKRLKTYPNLTIYQMAYYTFYKRINIIPILNFITYDKANARTILEKEIGWEYYGGHHYENLYSAWAFGWYTLRKFGFDKRKVSLSGPVRMGTLPREDAKREIYTAPAVKEDLTDYVCKKLGLTLDDFNSIMEAPNKSFREYRSSYDTILKFKWLIRLLVDRGVLSPVIYHKFF